MSKKAPCIEEKQRVRQTAVRYSENICIYIYILRHTSVHVSMMSAQGCVSALCLLARARVCWSYFANLSTVSFCLPVHTVTHTHTSNTKNTGKYMSRNDGKLT